MRKLSVILFSLVLHLVVYGQDNDLTPVITADNSDHLQSVQRLDFDAFEATFAVGWFAATPNASHFLVLDDEQALYVLDRRGDLTAIMPPTDFVDAVAFGDDHFAILTSDEIGYQVVYTDLIGTRRQVRVQTQAIPLAIWVTCPDTSHLTSCYANIEALQTDGSSVVMSVLPLASLPNINETIILSEDAAQIRPYAPTSDTDAIVRIGRVALPYVVTSSADGIVTLWHNDDNSVLAEVDNQTGQAAVFGNINGDASHLIWRDGESSYLHLLDFAAATNRRVAALNGAYVQWYFLSHDASVALGINYGDDPVIMAWHTQSGEAVNLGTYRPCSRPQPDMAHLSGDGRTLIIGCDTGLDIWQVSTEGT